MYCPMTSFKNLAYLYKYYPRNFEYMISKMRETEYNLSKKYGKKWTVRGNERYDVDYIENIVKTKWLKKLEEIDNQPIQINLFDKLSNDGGNNDK